MLKNNKKTTEEGIEPSSASKAEWAKTFGGVNAGALDCHVGAVILLRTRINRYWP